jgi:N-acetylmuramic acid 6-phosphate etherase
MQATTAELLVVGSALELALHRWWKTGEALPDPRQAFRHLLRQLAEPFCVSTLAQVTEFEESVYRQHGLMTYASNWALLDVLTDTTERSPTFMTPPFRKHGDTQAPLSWAFVKSPLVPTEQAWRQMLKRAPRGLAWPPEVYQQLGAPAALQRQPPQLDNREIHRFRIGNECAPERSGAAVNAHMAIGFADEMRDLYPAASQSYQQAAMLSIGEAALTETPPEPHFHFPLHLPDSPLRLWRHLAIKLVLNTLSTATMCRMERVLGNAMVWVSPSNKKLIDRGCRLIVQTTGCTYEQACIRLFHAIEQVDALHGQGQEPPSPVAMAINEIGTGN